MASTYPSRRVPTAVLTGFLGVGKTTTLRHLLRQKPEHEFWAVVLNEFGEVSIDAAVVAASTDGVVVREIAGGCICCVTAPVLRVGIQRLLQARWPDRLLIEPTGLGHPARIVAMLRDPWMSRSLDLRAVLCMVDAREFAQEKFRNHPIYAEQLRVANAVVVNKSELAAEVERAMINKTLGQMSPPKRMLGFVSNGAIESSWLDIGDQAAEVTLDEMRGATLMGSRVPNTSKETAPVAPLGAGDFVRANRIADGYQSYAWVFSAASTFSEDAMRDLMTKLGRADWLGADAVRAKALIRIDDRAWIAFNWRSGAWSAEKVEHANDSRFEIVLEAQQPFRGEAEFERALMSTLRMESDLN